MSAAEALERDLRTPASRPSIDTVARRLDGEWRKCLYVFHDQPVAKVRECLVFQYRWEPPAAERRISLYADSIQRVRDSLLAAAIANGRRAEAERQVAAAQARRRAARAAAAEQRRRDSIYLATHQERLDGPEVPIEPGTTKPWVVDMRTGAYYRVDCPAAARIPEDARKFYGFEIEAVDAGHWPSRQPGCGDL